VNSNRKQELTDTSSFRTVPSALLIQTHLGRVSLWGDVGTTKIWRHSIKQAGRRRYDHYCCLLLDAGGPETAQAEAARYSQTSGQL